MHEKTLIDEQEIGRQLQVSFRDSIVESLYADGKSLTLGLLSAIVAMGVTVWLTASSAFLVCFCLFVAISAVRLFNMQAYHKASKLEGVNLDLARWDTRYLFYGCLSNVVLGTWWFLAFYVQSDTFVQLFVMALSLANTVGISGRNYGSRRLVVAQILCLGIPAMAGMLLSGILHYQLLTLFMVPYFLSVMSISARLRATLFEAVKGKQDISIIANRFDTALSNMRQGLCMFDNDYRLVVANKRMAELAGIDNCDFLLGSTTDRIIEEVEKSELLQPQEGQMLSRKFDTYLKSDKADSMRVELADGKTIRLEFQPMDDGGALVTFEDITEKLMSAAKLKRMARYDALTGLSNRQYFVERLTVQVDRATKQSMCAVVAIDLDKFKDINDTLGHPCGDEILSQVSQRLRDAVGTSENISRFGSDEFVVMLTKIRSEKEVELIVKQLIASVNKTLTVGSNEISMTASAGVAIVPVNATGAEDVLRKADMALNLAKAEGKSSIKFFEDEMGIALSKRHMLERDLHKALGDKQLQLYFQPLIDLDKKRIQTCEALLRWLHPERGMVSPADFIPIAEQTGLIVEIGAWVLEEACRQCASWPDKVSVAVNLSAVQFRRGDVISSVRAALEKTGLAAHRLEVEITESILLQDLLSTRETLVKLRDMGVRVSLDDFGTGYSSLSYLHSLPLNKVKIDRSFINELKTNERSITLLRGITQLSYELGLSIVVEGVETEEQYKIITSEVTVNEIQGYLFGVPLTAKNIQDLLQAAYASAKIIEMPRRGRAPKLS